MADTSSVPDNVTVIDGVRVRKDDEKQFRAQHKAVLSPTSSKVINSPESTTSDEAEAQVEGSGRKAPARKAAAKSVESGDGADA